MRLTHSLSFLKRKQKGKVLNNGYLSMHHLKALWLRRGNKKAKEK